MRQYFKWLSLIFVCASLVACSSSHSPKGVAKSFWDGVLKQDQTVVRQFTSTQTQDQVDFTHNTMNWSGMTVKLGATDMMGDTAVVHTQVIDSNTGLKYSFGTYLVQEGGVWKVDYVRTRHASMTSEIFASLIGSLQKLNESLDKDFSGTVAGFKEAAPDLKIQLEQLSNRFASNMQPATTPEPTGTHKKLEDLKHAIMGIFEHSSKSTPPAAPVKPEVAPAPAAVPAH